MDEVLAATAAEQQISKAAVVRRLIDQHLLANRETDPLDELVGAWDDEPGDVDATVYDS